MVYLYNWNVKERKPKGIFSEVMSDTNSQVNIESSAKKKWKSMLDLISEITESPGAFVIRSNANGEEIILKSCGNIGMADIVNALMPDAVEYGKKVINTHKKLIVNNSLKNDEWKQLPSGLTAFMGFPIFWPSGHVFGVICIIDKKEQKFWNWSQQLLAQYAAIMQDDLAAALDRQRLNEQRHSRAHDEEVLRQTEEQFRKIFQSSPAAILITALKDGRIIDANDSYLRLFGFKIEELIGSVGMKLSIFDDPEVREVMVSRLDNGESVRDYETTLYTKTGEMRKVLISLDKTVFNDETCLIYTVYDLTSLIALKENLKRMNDRFSLASRVTEMGTWDWDIITGVIAWDAQMSALYGNDSAAFTGTFADWLAYVHPDDVSKVQERLSKTVNGQEKYEDEFRIIRADGDVRNLKAIGNTVRDDNGRALRMTGVNIDITTAQKNQMRFQESEARYQSLFHNNDAVQMLVDCETGSICDANTAACQFYGLTGDEKKKLWEIDTCGENVIRKRLAKAYEKGTDNFSTQHIRFDGQQRDVEIFGGRVEIGGKKLYHMIVQDIAERKRTERGLIESEKRFRLFVENAPDGVFVEMDDVFSYVNGMTVELLGAASEHDLLGNPIYPYFSAASQKKMAARFRQLRVGKKPLEMVKETIIQPDGRHVEVEISAVPFHLGGEDGALVFLHDITLRKQLEKEKLHMEAQLRQKQKLESIGILAGGVAHEINNPVSGIINYAQLITESPGADADIVEFGGEIIKEGQRIAGIVKNLLKFARQEKQTHSLAQVNDIINETLLLIRTIIRTDRIVLDVSLAPNLPSVKCRSQQIQQVLMNLITNARDALNARYRQEHKDKRILLSSAYLQRPDGSEWVRVTVQDQGMGIPDDVKDKMFDPFFTTKSRNEGTGLGLSISHGIVQDHRGTLCFETELGRYTRAILELPVNNGWELSGKAEE